METVDMSRNTPPTAAEAKREDEFEKALADPGAPTLLHLNVYVRTILGILLLGGIIAFYISHLSGHGSLDTYGQIPYPSDANHLR